MGPVHEWEVQLSGGNPSLLHGLAGQNDPIGHFWIWGGIDHHLDCQNDHFSFNSGHLNDIHDDDDLAWQVAHELLSLFNGAVSLFTRHTHRFEILAILKDGYRADYSERRSAQGLLGALPSSMTRGVDRGDSSPIFRALSLACEYQDAYHLLKLFELDAGWVSYYKILETIESYRKIFRLEVPVDAKTQKSFELTANNFSLSGFDSRHGFKQQVKDIKTPSITIDEGYDFISAYARRYFVARYGAALNRRPVSKQL